MKQTTNLAAAKAGTPADSSSLVARVKQALLRPAMACVFLGISRTSLHRLSETDRTFPRKIVISRRCVGYRADALEDWLAAKEAAL
jgi:predicted DNA-binding transcriptional regulator AlpA